MDLTIPFPSFIIYLCLIFTVVQAGDYKGCFEENKRRRYMNVNPGDFDPNQLTTGDCASKCGLFGYEYAGLTSGNFCFCSSSIPPVGTQKADSDCDLPCSGSPSEMCGSKDHISVYQSSLPVVGLKVAVTTPPAGGVFVTGAQVDFDISIESGIGLYYQFSYDDGAARSPKNSTSMYSYTYNVPGVYSVQVFGSDLNNTIPEGQAVTTVVVEDKVGPVHISCPPECATHEYCSCEVKTYTGNNMQLVDTVDTAPKPQFSIADPIYDTVGFPIPTLGPVETNTGGDGIYVLEYAEFKMEGRILGFNIYAQTAGTLKIMVLTPSCTGANIYCPESNTCAPTCLGYQTSDCTAGSEFCPDTRKCSPGCPASTRHTAGTLKNSYTIKQSISLTLVQNFQYYPISDIMDVMPGDILAFEQTAGNGVVSLSLQPLNAIDNEFKFATAATIAPGGAVPATQKSLINAYMSVPSVTLLQYEFTSAGTYTIKADVSTTTISSTETNSTTANVIEGINITDIIAPVYVAVGAAVDFNLAPQSGSSVVHTVNFGDGSDETPASLPHSHTFTYAGIFNVTWTSSNSLSAKSGFTEVTVEHTIASVAFNSLTSSTGVNTDFSFTMATGSNFTCDWNFGDGNSVQKTDTDTPSGGAATVVSHIYSTDGTFTVTVNCSNNINSEMATNPQTIQSRIVGLTLGSVGASKNVDFTIQWTITAGTDPTASLLFDGVPFVKDAVTNGFRELNNPATSWETTLIPGKPVGLYPLELTVQNLLNSEVQNISFKVIVGMAGVTSTVSKTTVPTRDDVTFTLNMIEGSSVNVVYDWDDGTFFNFSLNEGDDWAVAKPAGDTQTHQFADGRLYNVVITAWNSAGTNTFPHAVNAIQSVNDIVMNNEKYYRFTPPAYPHFNFTAASPPNGANVFFDFGDDKQETKALNVDYNYYHQYRDEGSYTVTANVSNSISSKLLATNITIIEVLQGLTLKSIPPQAASFGDPFSLDVILFRAPTGSDCLMNIDYGDPAIPVVTGHIRTGSGENGKDTFVVTYNTLGPYTITVDVTTTLMDTLTETHIIQVQHKVKRPFTATSAPQASGYYEHGGGRTATVTINYPGTPFPTDAFYSLEFGDGTFDNGSFTATPSPTILAPHTFAVDGLFEAVLTIYNLASSESETFPLGSFIRITGSTVALTYKPALPLDAPAVQGLGTAGEFPRDRPVIFTMTHSAGTIVDYSISYVLTSGGTPVVVTRTTNPFEILLPESGDFTVTITARNPLFSDLVVTTLTILDRVVNYTIADNSPRVGPGETKMFNITHAIQGDMTCLLVDFGDGTQQTWADNPTHCTNQGFVPAAALHVNTLTGLNTIGHIYNANGFYTVTLDARNTFSESKDVIGVPVSSAQCTQPQVEIENQSFQFFNPMKFKRGKLLRVFGKSAITCSTTLQNKKLWDVVAVDDNTGVDGATVDISSLSSRVNAELSVPANFLAYGLYKFTFSMEMLSDNFDGGRYKAVSHTYLAITKSDIVGVIETGGLSEVVRGHGSIVTLKPASFSYDPDDATPIGSQTFDSFVWTCEPANENATSAYCASMMAGKTTDSPLNIDTTVSVSSADYKFCVKITKDTRNTIACLIVKLIDGAPPSVYLECTSGSVCTQQQGGQLIPPSGRLGVKCGCTDCLPTENINYRWTFYVYDYKWPWKSVENFDQYAKGLNSDAISISKDIFKDYSTVMRFRASCEATKQGQTTAGLAIMNFEINGPPHNGTCSISKIRGIVSVKREFCIMCENWVDPNGITEYKIIVRLKDDQVGREVIVVKQFDEEKCIDLPMGAAYNDFKEDVFVQIRDSLGAMTEHRIAEVIVESFSEAESKKLIADFLNNDFDPFDKAYAEGDTNDVVALTSNLVAILNSDSKTTQSAQSEYNGVGVASSKTNSGFGPSDANRTGAYYQTDSPSNPTLEAKYEREKDQRAQLKQQGVQALSSLTAESATSILQIASGLSEFVHYPEEVTLVTAKTALGKTLQMAKTMANISDMSYEDRKNTFIYMAATIGGSLSAIGFNGEHPSLTEKDEAEASPAFKVYDTNWENEKDAIDAPNLEAARGVHSEHVHKNHVGAESTTYIDVAIETLTILSQGIAKNSVPGEEIEFVTNHMKGVVAKNDAKSLLGKEITVKDSSTFVKIPDDISAIFTGGNGDGNKSVVLQVLQTSSVPYQYSPNSNALGQTTNGLTIELFDDAGIPQVIKNLQKPFEFTIEKDHNAPPLPFNDTDPLIVEWDWLYYHKMNITKRGASLHVQLDNIATDVKLLLLVRFGELPDLEKKLFHYMGVIPNMLVEEPYRYSYFLSNKEVNDFIGTVYIGVRKLDPSEDSDSYNTPADLPEYEKGTGKPESYKVRFFSTGCYFFDETSKDWSSEGCRVGYKTDDKVTHCFCNHLTTFAGGWVVVPNTIDWNFIFANSDFAKNPTLYITEIVIAVVYLLSVFWARREDKKDIEKIGLTPLKDNDPRDKYYYEVSVVTGMRKNAGTDSKVCFILSGEYDETDVRMFSDNKRKIFRRGSVDAFLVAVPRPLGTLNYARIWHDNSGKGKTASWYLKYLLVRDVQTNQRHVFICNKWFAVEEDDGQVDRVIPVAGKEQMTEFGHLFAEKSRKNLIDGHLWFSVVARPANSRFTRVQRVSCCLLLLYVSMLGNAMFYGQDTGSANTYNFGPFALSPEQIFIGIAVNLIVFPINFLVITFFRKSRARKLRPSRIAEALKQSGAQASATDSKSGIDDVWMSTSPTLMDDQKRAGTSASMRPETSFSSVSRMGTRQYEALRTNKKKKNKKCELPWWCTIVGWIFLWLGVGVSLAFVTFYGITFEDEKCKKWITSMLMSFFTSVFITQPVKVFLTAIFFSLVVKNPGEEEEDEIEDEEKHQLASDEEFLHFEDGYGATRPRKIGYKPPDPAELEKARIQRLNEIKMWEIIREIVFYSFFLWILMVISYRNRSPHGFYYKQNLVSTFLDNNDTKHLFSKVRNTAEYWKWSQSGLLNGIRASNYYNSDPPLLLRGFVNDKVSRIMGYATMRQLRVQQGACDIRGVMTPVIPECNEGYSYDTEDEGYYIPGWKTPNNTQNINDTSLEWKYTQADVLNGYPFWGVHAVYGGGGYVVQLRGSKETIETKLKSLEDMDWIDRYTRAVFVEFTIYNPQVNLFAIGTMLAEFDQSGGVTTSSRFEPALLLTYMSSVMLFQIACEVVYLIFTAWFIIKAIRSIFKERMAYFKQFWNIIELGIIAVSIGAVIVYFYRLLITNELTAIFARSHGNEYMKFQYAGYWNEIFSYMIGWLVFFGTLKFLKLLRFNKRMSLIAATLSHGSKSLMHFGIIFLIVYMAFMQLFYLTFMNLSTAFQTFINSMESGILMMMGKFDIYSMAMVEPILTQIFVFLFVVTITFILVNMFLSILNETFGAVREDMSKANNDYEIVEFMVSRFKRWTGMGAAPANTLQPSDLMADGKPNPYANPQDSVNHFPERIDKLLNSISNIYMDEDGIARRMTAKEQAANKSNMKSMIRGHSSSSPLTDVD